MCEEENAYLVKPHYFDDFFYPFSRALGSSFLQRRFNFDTQGDYWDFTRHYVHKILKFFSVILRVSS